jgi:hypothetical protein
MGNFELVADLVGGGIEVDHCHSGGAELNLVVEVEEGSTSSCHNPL